MSQVEALSEAEWPLVYLGLGTNLGEREAHLARAAGGLAAMHGIDLERCSAVFDSAPLGPAQPRFLNAVIQVRTCLPPLSLLAQLKDLERALGRVPAERHGPRVVDVDILLWGERIVALPGLQVPHLALHQRAFALAPLCELAPGARHPVLNQTVQELLASLFEQDVVRVASFPGGW